MIYFSFTVDLQEIPNSGFAKMVFCSQNCSDLQREKIALVIQKKKLNFEAKSQEFAKILKSLDQLIQTVKCQNSF